MYDAWNSTDPAGAVIPFLDRSFEFVNPPYAVEPGTRHGHRGWVDANTNTAAAFEFYKHEPGEMIETNDKIICFATFVAQSRAGEVPYEKREGHVWTLHDGRVVRFEWFHDDQEALQAAGVAPCRRRQA